MGEVKLPVWEKANAQSQPSAAFEAREVHPDQGNEKKTRPKGEAVIGQPFPTLAKKQAGERRCAAEPHDEKKRKCEHQADVFFARPFVKEG